MKKELMYPKGTRTLFLDIETISMIASVFSRYPNFIATSSILARAHVLMVGWKWSDEKTPHIMSIRTNTEKEIMEKVAELYKEATCVVMHNGVRFDMTHLRTRAMELGVPPFSEPPAVDTLKEARHLFRFESNRLDDLGRYLNIGCKTPGSKTLWDDISHIRLKNGGVLPSCAESPELDKLLAKMEKYCKNDVFPLQQRVYERMRPWMKRHPNIAMMGSRPEVGACNKCGSNDVSKWGVRLILTMITQRHRCNNCGSVFDGKRAKTKEALTND